MAKFVISQYLDKIVNVVPYKDLKCGIVDKMSI